MAESEVLEAVRDRLIALPEPQREAFVKRLSPAQRHVAHLALQLPALQPHQKPPQGDWFIWLLLAGRGAGKTYACAHWFNEHMNGPPCDSRIPGGHRASIIAPSHSDAYDSCVAGPSGLMSINPSITSQQSPSGRVARWPNGAEARLFGAYTPEDIERQRAGGNRCAVWAEELAAWVKLDGVWDHMIFGLRVGERPRIIASTTPKPRPLLRGLLTRADTVVTRARTTDNPHLPTTVVASLHERYGGTRLGRQELEGELLTDVEGALWSAERLAANRVVQAPPLRRIVVGVDPPGTTKAECGIVIVGQDRGKPPEFYVLGDYSLRGSPENWAREVVRAYHDFSADRIIFEHTQGWDMGPTLVRQVDPNVSMREVHARKGKYTRAEPVAALDEQGRWHMVGAYPELEEQLCEWTPDDDVSPDRLDAMVWAGTEFLGRTATKDKLVAPGGVTSPSYWRAV